MGWGCHEWDQSPDKWDPRRSSVRTQKEDHPGTRKGLQQTQALLTSDPGLWKLDSYLSCPVVYGIF